MAHVRGHIGLFPLLAEIVPVAAVPVVAAAVGGGNALAAALVAGADAGRLGTLFIATTESPAHPAYVDALIAARAEDTIVTTAFGDGWPDAPHRVLRSAVEAGTALGDAQSWTPQWPVARHTWPDRRAGALRRGIRRRRALAPTGDACHQGADARDRARGRRGVSLL